MTAAQTAASGTHGLVIVGNPAEEHVGSHFRHAAASLGWSVDVCDVREAFGRWSIWRSVSWRLSRRPVRLGSFSRYVAQVCGTKRPEIVLATGVAPLRAKELQMIAARGVTVVNFLTDDPWNRVHRASWFLGALPHYDLVVSPRRVVLADLRAQGCRAVRFLPFAYAPEVHFPAPATINDREATDVLFVGGADSDRIPIIRALLTAGLRVSVYGDYWDKQPDLRACWRGIADLPTVRAATRGAKVVLGIVRHANRDGNAMRSFEVPAMRGCMLAEDTEEHREIFGPHDAAVRYFRTTEDLITQTRWLLSHPDDRERLAGAAHALVTGRRHSYADRFRQILEWIRPVTAADGQDPAACPDRISSLMTDERGPARGGN